MKIENQKAADIEQEYGLPPGSLLSTLDGQVFDKPPANVDHEKSLRSAQQPTVHGVCPSCGEGWITTDSKLIRRIYAGESFWCRRCAGDRIAIPADPSLRSPSEDETTDAQRMIKVWADRFRTSREDVKRLEDDLARMTHRCKQAEIAYTHSGNELKEWMKSGETMHERFIAVENQLAESRRNFAIIAKILRGPHED